MASGTRAAHCSCRRPNRHDVIKTPQPTKLQPARNVLRLGFVPLADCAPLVMAQESSSIFAPADCAKMPQLLISRSGHRSSVPTFLKKQPFFAVQLRLIMKLTPTPKSNSRPLERAPLDTTTKPAVDSLSPRRRSGERVRERGFQKSATIRWNEPLSPALSPLVPRRERGHFSDGGCIKMRPPPGTKAFLW